MTLGAVGPTMSSNSYARRKDDELCQRILRRLKLHHYLHGMQKNVKLNSFFVNLLMQAKIEYAHTL
jgi:hypothetical protein